GVATTMRMKFEKLSEGLIPGTAKREEALPSELGHDVDLVAIVERLRNVPKPQQAMAFAEVVDSSRQAGDPDYRKPPAPTVARAQPDDDFDMRYGLKPATFGLRSQND
ncbi:MAG: ATPase, partial [Mesorhizobium sp.]